MNIDSHQCLELLISHHKKKKKLKYEMSISNSLFFLFN